MSIEDDIVLGALVGEALSRARSARVERAQVVGDEIFDEDHSSLEENAMELAKFFGALGNRTRMEIVAFLHDHEATAGEIALVLELLPSSLSHHLKVLEQAGVIIARRSGRERVFSLSPDVKRRL